MIPAEAWRLYLVTDNPSVYAKTERETGKDWLTLVSEAIDGGVTVVQYRDTESDDDALLDRARALRGLLDRRGIPLIVNNRADLVAPLRADGVHVGQSDLPPREVRRIVGPDVAIGWSITRAADVDPEQLAFVDSTGVGPVFDARGTKPDAAPPLGVSGLAELVAAMDRIKKVPAVAIGGMNPGNAGDMVRAGAAGVAVVSAFSRTATPAEAAREFIRAMRTTP